MQHLQGLDKAYRNAIYICHNAIYTLHYLSRWPVKEIQIHNELKLARIAANLTQQQLADKVEVSRQTIVAIEKGNYSPSLELAFRLAEIFDSPIQEVFSYESPNI